MAARLRHIALSVPDPEKAAVFFEQAFGMKRAGKAGIGLYMSDGTVNVALLKFDGDVPGMPPGLAAEIVQQRDQWGPFTSISQLRTDLGVDAATVTGLGHYLRVVPPPP